MTLDAVNAIRITQNSVREKTPSFVHQLMRLKYCYSSHRLRGDYQVYEALVNPSGVRTKKRVQVAATNNVEKSRFEVNGVPETGSSTWAIKVISHVLIKERDLCF